jgi:hypothetical protein
MKNSIKFAIMAASSIALCYSLTAQDNSDGPSGQGPRHGRGPGGPPKDPAAIVQHLTEAFAAVAPYDANKDGQLDETELKALSQAIKDGTVQLPRPPKPHADAGPQHPRGGSKRLAEIYRQIAPYDVDKNGVLSEQEQATLKADIESGKLTLPRGPRGAGPRGERPPPGDNSAN